MAEIATTPETKAMPPATPATLARAVKPDKKAHEKELSTINAEIKKLKERTVRTQDIVYFKTLSNFMALVVDSNS